MEYGVIGFVPGYDYGTGKVDTADFNKAIDLPNTIVYGVKWYNGDPTFIVDRAEILFRYILGWVSKDHPVGTPLVLYAQKTHNKFSILLTVHIEAIVERFKKDGPSLDPEDRVFVINKHVHHEGPLSEHAKTFFGRESTSICFVDVKDIQSEIVNSPVQIFRLEKIKVSYDLSSFPDGMIVTEIKTPNSEVQ